MQIYRTDYIGTSSEGHHNNRRYCISHDAVDNGHLVGMDVGN